MTHFQFQLNVVAAQCTAHIYIFNTISVENAIKCSTEMHLDDRNPHIYSIHFDRLLSSCLEWTAFVIVILKRKIPFAFSTYIHFSALIWIFIRKAFVQLLWNGISKAFTLVPSRGPCQYRIVCLAYKSAFASKSSNNNIRQLTVTTCSGLCCTCWRMLILWSCVDGFHWYRLLRKINWIYRRW